MGNFYHGNNKDGIKFNNISTSNIGRWPERISDEEAMIIEYWLGDVMKIWNYDRKFQSKSLVTNYINFYEKINSKYFFHDRLKLKN